MTKISWHDLCNLTPKEIKKKYKTTDHGLELGVRRHMDGANHNERRELYKSVWDKKQ